MEVRQGGFYRFFFSRKGRFAALALAGFRALGAGNYATVMQSAMGIYPGSNVPRDVKERRLALKDRKNKGALKRCDTAIRHFWKADPLDPYVYGYIKRNLDDFVLDYDPDKIGQRR